MLVTDLLPIGMTALLVAIILVVVLDRTEVRNDRPQVFPLLLVRFFGLFWVMAAAFLLFKIRMISLHELGNPLDAMNFVPFRTIANYLRTRNVLQLLGNSLVLLPFPILLRLNFPTLKSKVFRMILLFVTILIEPAQLLTNVLLHSPFNAIDIDDFLLNAIGCFLGFAIVKLIDSIGMRRKEA